MTVCNRIAPPAELGGSEQHAELSAQTAVIASRDNELTPRANAIAAIDTPGCWHSPTVSALNSSL
jgi:hypothetical protein